MRPEEVAELLRISAKTLANWRSSNRGPAWRKHGGKVVYRRAAVVEWSTENTGARPEGKPNLSVTTRPYPKDRTRSQVDIMIHHPLTHQVIRRRLAAPDGYDPAAARKWGESQVQNTLRDLFVAQAKPSEEERPKEPQKQEHQVPTLGDLWKEYSEHIPTKKESQRRTKRRHWAAIQAIAGHIPCDAWTHREDRKIAERFQNQSAGYLKNCMVLLRHLFTMAAKAKYIADVPKLPSRKVEDKVPEVAHGQEEIASLLAAARKLGEEGKEPLELMILIGLDGGLRPGEVAGLRWKDVDWAANQIIVRNQRPLAGNSDTAVKTNEAGRVNLTRRLRLALETHRPSSSSKYVITNGDGEPLYTSRISTRVEKVHKLAGLDPQGAHFMRHCSASRIFSASGGSVSAAQAHLRHKLASTTERYLHRVRGTSAGRQAAEILDALDALELATTGNRLAPGPGGTGVVTDEGEGV